MARDLFHENVKEALAKEGWIVTDYPLTFKIGNIQVQIDLGVERLIAAERSTEKIAIEPGRRCDQNLWKYFIYYSFV